MASFINFRTAVLLISSLLAVGWQGLKADVWRASDPTYVPFAVLEIVGSSDNRVVGLTVVTNGKEPQTMNDIRRYLLDVKTGEHRLLGPEGTLLPIANGDFIYSESKKTTKPLVLIHGLDTVRTFDIGKNSGGWWNAKTATAFFETGWPANNEGFNVLTLVHPAPGAITRLQLKETSAYWSACPATGNFYTEHRSPRDDGATEYSSEGGFIKTMQSSLAVYSPNCQYVLPFAAIDDGPDDWAVFDATSGTKLMDFPWIEDGRSDLHGFDSWNPRQDNLLLMHSIKQRSKGETIDLVDVSKRRVIRTWPHPEGTTPVRWSGDGESTVTIRDHHVVFEPLPTR